MTRVLNIRLQEKTTVLFWVQFFADWYDRPVFQLLPEEYFIKNMTDQYLLPEKYLDNSQLQVHSCASELIAYKTIGNPSIFSPGRWNKTLIINDNDDSILTIIYHHRNRWFKKLRRGLRDKLLEHGIINIDMYLKLY